MCENLPAGELSSRMSPVQCPSRLSYPSCQDLGIPYVDFTCEDGTRPDTVVMDPACLPQQPKAHKNMFRVNGMTYDIRDPNNPFSPYCRIPLPSPFGAYEYCFEPAFIRKRNERERERVRCVNEGYVRLRQHLPVENDDKRISKVETLRCAISYIEHLQSLLLDLDNDPNAAKLDDTVAKRNRKRKSTPCSDDGLHDVKLYRRDHAKDDEQA